jgi:hypothetical protein
VTAPLVKVRIPSPRDHRFKSWARLITGVDCSRKDGYAFQGPWLRRGRLDELPALALILLYDEVGSRRHHQPYVEVLQVQGDGSLAQAEDVRGPLRAEGRDWALLLRDRVAALLDAAPGRPLKGITTQELAQELVLRQDGIRCLVDALLSRLLVPDPLAVILVGELISSVPDLQAGAEAARRRLAFTEEELTTQGP